jgi:hypothetical protein
LRPTRSSQKISLTLAFGDKKPSLQYQAGFFLAKQFSTASVTLLKFLRRFCCWHVNGLIHKKTHHSCQFLAQLTTINNHVDGTLLQQEL